MYWLVGGSKGDNTGSGDNIGGKRLTRLQSISVGPSTVPSRNYEKTKEKSFDNVLETSGVMESAKISKLEEWRLDTQKFMASTSIGVVYFNFFVALSVASLFQYIVETYLDEENNEVSVR